MSSITPADIRWRVVRKTGSNFGQLVGYIDGRKAMEELDNLDPDWRCHHTPYFSEGKLVLVQCEITVDGVTRSDTGVPSKQDPEKGAYSDALKRAAVHFGIGRELYDLPQVYAPLNGSTPAIKPRFNEETGRWEIDEPGYVIYPQEEEEPAENMQKTPRNEARAVAKRLGLTKDDIDAIAAEQGLSMADNETFSDDDWRKLTVAMIANQPRDSDSE